MDQSVNKISVAPMMGWTDRHDRFFLRQISGHARLYTEMLTADAVRHGERARLLDFHPNQHPVALQLGGGVPEALAEAAAIGSAAGYDEINLNVGCPSGRVQHGRFGACLMRDPALVARCVAAMHDAGGVPVTVKHRVGVDDQDGWSSLRRFVETVAKARGMDPAAIRETQGATFTGEAAVAAGLADRVGTAEGARNDLRRSSTQSGRSWNPVIHRSCGSISPRAWFGSRSMSRMPPAT